VLLVTGRNTPHLKALTNELIHVFKDAGLHGFRHSGRHESGWMVVDLLDIVIHIFAPQTRSYYALEELWSDAPRVSEF